MNSSPKLCEIQIPQCAKGIGDVILKPDASTRIPGVEIEPVSLWPDDRGYFLEVGRFGQGALSRFPAESTQVSSALSYPGTIKAFHFHRRQTDVWVPMAGMFQVALVDLRAGSSTHGQRNTLYVGNMRPWRIVVPPGIGHGYKVVGTGPGVLVYITDRFYDPEDEGRIAYDDAGIHYDWEIQHK